MTTNELTKMADRLAKMAREEVALKNDTMAVCGGRYLKVTATERTSW